MYFLDQKSFQAIVVKLYWQIKAQINLKKISQLEEQKGERMKKTEENLPELWTSSNE